MKCRHAALILVASMLVASCSKKSAPDRENNSRASEAPRESPGKSEPEGTEGQNELQPDEEKIEEDCLAFVRSTKVLSAQPGRTDCPGCPGGGAKALSFRQMTTNAVSCSGDTCDVVVTIRAVFNPGSGETLAGGLTAWIPPEERSAYLSGRTPSGEQNYRVHITYKRRGEAWRAVEFDRAPVE